MTWSALGAFLHHFGFGHGNAPINAPQIGVARLTR